jgi:cyclopropane-fatty-acyl-phospholipid synthase
MREASDFYLLSFILFLLTGYSSLPAQLSFRFWIFPIFLSGRILMKIRYNFFGMPTSQPGRLDSSLADAGTHHSVADRPLLAHLAKKQFEKFLEPPITIDGHAAHDIQVHDERLYLRALLNGTLGLGEAYMDGWWDCEALDEFFTIMLSGRLLKKLKYSPRMLVTSLKNRCFNLQKRSQAFRIAEQHYNLGNDLYRSMLDERMIYSCAYWENVSTLKAAQEAKLDLICRKLKLQPGMSLLDIGSGWGGLAKFAAERYGVKVVGITVSVEQREAAVQACKGLPVEFRMQDYREVAGEFDRVVSVGMFEHVGHKNYRDYMETVHRCLKDRGLFLLHTIGSTEEYLFDPWILKYIFPGAVLPSLRQISSSIKGLFDQLDVHEFGKHYDPTLMAWFRNFDRNWPSIRSQYDERFYRMWKYYLLSCAGYFRSGLTQVWQIVLGKNAAEFERIR